MATGVAACDRLSGDRFQSETSDLQHLDEGDAQTTKVVLSYTLPEGAKPDSRQVRRVTEDERAGEEDANGDD